MLRKALSVLIFMVGPLSCSPDCDYPCAEPIIWNQWCAHAKTCRLDGTLVTDCDQNAPQCPLWWLEPNVTLSLPYSPVRAAAGARNDLLITGPGVSSGVVLFDGVEQTGCTRQLDQIECDNLPGTLGTVEFRYSDPPTPGHEVTYVELHDRECEATHDLCPG